MNSHQPAGRRQAATNLANSPRHDGFSWTIPESPISSLPPVLPPIPHVALTDEIEDAQHVDGSTSSLLPQSGATSYIDGDSISKTSTQEEVNNGTGNMAPRNQLPFEQQQPPMQPATKSISQPDLRERQINPPLATRTNRLQKSQGNNLPRSMSSNNVMTSPKLDRGALSSVAYDSVTSPGEPRSGGRPLQATGRTAAGVPQHRTSTGPQELHSQKASKSRMNLLNPVSLLMRRRSSQQVETGREDVAAPKKLTVPPMDLPEDYDPRIRGNVVHDFSAPRPRRNFSYNDAVSNSTGYTPDLSIRSPDMLSPHMTSESPRPASQDYKSPRTSAQHLPIFVEHIDEEEPADNRSSAVNAEALANKGFLSRVSWQSAKSDHSQESPVLPPFARRSQQFEVQQTPVSDEKEKRTSDPSSISAKSEVSALSRSEQQTPRELQSPVSPEIASRASRPLSDEDVSTLASSASGEEHVRESQLLSIDEAASSPASSPPGLPRHFKSNASRFSFQIGGPDSAESEKLLEARHQLRSADNGEESKEHPIEDDIDEDEEEFFDEDAMYDHDEIEDLNEDDDLDNMNNFTQPQQQDSEEDPSQGLVHDLTAFRITQGEAMPPIFVGSPLQSHPVQQPHSREPSGSHSEMETPKQVDTTPKATTETSPPSTSSNAPPVESTEPKSLEKHGLGLQDSFLEESEVQTSTIATASPYDDDIYFDDGNFGDDMEEVTSGGSPIDENAFDDPNFLKRTTSHAQDDYAPMSPYDEPHEGAPWGAHNQTFLDMDDTPEDQPYDFQQENFPRARANTVVQGRGAGPGVNAPLHDRKSSVDEYGYVHNNLQAYHSALASAAHQAAASGRFIRHNSTATSVSQYSDDIQEPPPTERPGTNTSMHSTDRPGTNASFTSNPTRLGSAHGQPSRDSYSGFNFGFDSPANPSPMSTTFPQADAHLYPAYSTNADNGFPSDYDLPSDNGFPSDYDLDDDAIVAAANASALEADESGFYGTEFGFYARARDPSAAESVNGGYFGAEGIDMLQRQRSVKEPNLTPITERSEFSTRNSFIGSMGMGGIGMGGLSSPFSARGAMSPMAWGSFGGREEEASLEQLRRLRGQAFGGTSSNGSLRSVGMDPLSSPLVTGFMSPVMGPMQAQAPVPGMGGSYFAAPRAPLGGVPMMFQYSTDSSGSGGSASHSHGQPNHNPNPNHNSNPHTSATTTTHPASRPTSTDLFGPQLHPPLAPAPAPAPAPVSQPAYSHSPTPASPSSSHHSLPVYDTDATPRKPPPSSANITSPGPVSPPPTARKGKTGQGLEQGPGQGHGKGQGKGHSRNHSGADSVTYVQEREEDGRPRWVLERRRVSEAGLLELVGREVVEGGRI
ncbi:hypothetical protein M8818_002050 [Zalaria obscura]|uniref:Uncharacterized protein n=1 Tax=Zalaria obscura TaxID=2024903 RepID=A0ACC3SJD9_9PEZI